MESDDSKNFLMHVDNRIAEVEVELEKQDEAIKRAKQRVKTLEKELATLKKSKTPSSKPKTVQKKEEIKIEKRQLKSLKSTAKANSRLLKTMRRYRSRLAEQIRWDATMKTRSPTCGESLHKFVSDLIFGRVMVPATTVPATNTMTPTQNINFSPTIIIGSTTVDEKKNPVEKCINDGLASKHLLSLSTSTLDSAVSSKNTSTTTVSSAKASIATVSSTGEKKAFAEGVGKKAPTAKRFPTVKKTKGTVKGKTSITLVDNDSSETE